MDVYSSFLEMRIFFEKKTMPTIINAAISIVPTINTDHGEHFANLTIICPISAHCINHPHVDKSNKLTRRKFVHHTMGYRWKIFALGD